MTREQFITMLESPAVIDLNRVRDLEEITQQFPYFQNAHMLLARQYYGHENIRYDSYIKKAASYAPDRTLLYKLIHTPTMKVVHVNEDVEQTPASVSETSHSDIAEQEVETPSLPTTAPVAETHVPAPEADDPRTILEKRLKELALHHDKAEEQLIDLPETNRLGETESSATQQLIDQEPEIAPTPVATQAIKVESAIPTGLTTHADKDEKKSFSDWLKQKSVPVKAAIEINAVSDIITDHPALSAPEKNKTVAATIIETFIQSEPRIEPAKSEFYSPGNMARKSLIEHDDLCSETLAKIYERQGNREKAAEMYRKLALKFPEKSGYFASLEKELGLDGH